ncbi:MAG: hypothetical protein QW270_08490 [Candidatus Bathyarchaeia archaeon]
MNKYLTTYCIQLMIASFSLSFLIPVSLAKSSITLGSRDSVPLNEINLDATITNMIAFYSFMAGYKDYNQYGAQTTRNKIFQAAFGNGHIYSISFYIGHGGSEYLWNGIFYEQQWFITDDEGGHVHDKDIFQHSGCKNCHFALLWSCFQGDTIGGKHWSGTPFGMPHAWLHTTSLSNDGYTSPDNGGRAFVGFKGVAPFLTYDGLGTTDAG